MTLKGVDTSSSGEKKPRWPPSDEQTHQDEAIVMVGSPNLASNDKPALGVCLNEASIPLEEEEPAVSPPSVEKVGTGAPSGVVIAPSKKRFPDRVIVSTYVLPLERVCLSPDMEAPDLEDVLKIARC